MKITNIKVENFKSYRKMNIELNDLNYIIGGNAAGKSNFVNILKFVNDIVEYGIDDAILLQGGIKYLFNSSSRKNGSLVLDFEISLNDEKNRISKIFPIENVISLPFKINYNIKIKPNEKGEGYKIVGEILYINFIKYQKNNEDLSKIDDFIIKITRDSNKKIIDDYKNIEDDINELIGLKQILKFIEQDGLLINNFFNAFGMFYRYNSKIKIYNFDVNLLKSPSSIVARGELEEDGSNLVNIIQRLLKNRSNKEKLKKILKNVLPFIDDIKVENNVNKSLFFKVQETYNKKEFPSYMLSDGTVNILAVIVALYFQNSDDVIVLEEPERNIHPKLLNTLVSLLEDVSKRKQIFITTHNPYIVKEADLKDVILVSRSEKGISTVSKPINNDNVKLFLENDLGIEDLFVNGLLK